MQGMILREIYKNVRHAASLNCRQNVKGNCLIIKTTKRIMCFHTQKAKTDHEKECNIISGVA